MVGIKNKMIVICICGTVVGSKTSQIFLDYTFVLFAAQIFYAFNYLVDNILTD